MSIAARPLSQQYCFCFILGMILSLGFAPHSYLIVIPVSIGLLFRMLQDEQKNKALFLKGFLYSLGHYITSLYWLVYPLFVDIQSYYYILPFTLLIGPAYLATYTGFAALMLKLIKRQELKVLAFACVWTIMEFIRSSFFLPFPWNLVGYSLDGHLELMQVSKIFGIYGVSFFVIFCSASLFSQYLKYLIATFIIISSSYLYGALELYSFNNNKHATNFSVRIVQPNSGNFLNKNIAQRYNALDDLLEATFFNLPSNNQLIVIPEGSFPFPHSGEHPDLSHRLQTFAKQYSTNIIAGMDYIDTTDQTQLFYNSAIIFTQNGAIIPYHKRILVPFGEYIPFRKFMPFAHKITEGTIDFSNGTFSNVIQLGKYKYILSICFESLFTQLFTTTNGGDFLINITNDSWFGDSVEPHQHLTFMRFRSIETGMTSIRAANTGISAIIDPVGNIQQTITLNTKGVVDAIIFYKFNGFLLLHIHHLWFIISALTTFIFLINYKQNKKKR